MRKGGSNEDRQTDRNVIYTTAERDDNGFGDMENLVTWLMTFGAKAEALEPSEARDIIRRNAEETLKIYGGLA